MQIYIHKNGQQLGPFDAAKVIEMLQNSEIRVDDFIFRQGDTEWSKVGTLYPNSNLRIIKLTLKTGLQIGWKLSDYTPIETVFVRVVDDNIEAFRRDYLEQFYARFFGENWRSGNSDGSMYQVLDEQIQKLTIPELALGDWRQPYTRCYLVKQGKIEKVELEEFESPNNFAEIKTAETTQNETANSTENSIQPAIDKMNDNIRLHLAGKLSFLDLSRKFMEFEYWIVPVQRDKVLSGESKNFTVFPTGNPDVNGVCFFTSPEALELFENNTPFSVDSHLVLSGEIAFDYDFSGLTAININPFYDNAVFFEGEMIAELNRMAKSKKLGKMPDRTASQIAANSNNPDEINLVLQQFKTNAVEEIEFVRKICEHNSWQCAVITPLTNAQLTIFTDKNNEQYAVVFTDEESYTKSNNKPDETSIRLFSIMSGEVLFAKDFSNLSYIAFNPSSENSVIFKQDKMYRFKGMTQSIKNERLLVEAQKSEDFHEVFREFENCDDWLWILNPDTVKQKNFAEVVNEKGERVFPVFTAPDLAKKFVTINLKLNSVKFEESDFTGIDARDLGAYILTAKESKVVFNLFTEKEIEFIETDELLKCFLVGFPTL
jgi:hypothetical protein